MQFCKNQSSNEYKTKLIARLYDRYVTTINKKEKHDILTIVSYTMKLSYDKLIDIFEIKNGKDV